MAITRLTKHNNHQVYVQLERWQPTGHYASLQCADCNTWIQWLHKWDVDTLRDLGVNVKPRKLITSEELGI